MSTSTEPASPSTSTNRVLLGRAVVLILAIGQVVSTVAFDVLSPAELESGVEFSPLVPPAPMFAIWGVIIAGSIFWAVLQVRPSVRKSPLRDGLVAPLSVVYAGFALWLAAASQGQGSPLTVLVFAVIVGAHVVAWRRIRRGRSEIDSWRAIDRHVLRLSEGLYTGWTSIAFFVNIATVVQGNGAPIEGTWGTAWQLLLIAAAAGAAVAFVVLTGGSIWYAAAACYALVGAAISASAAGFAVLTFALGIGVALVVGSTIAVRILGRNSNRHA